MLSTIRTPDDTVAPSLPIQPSGRADHRAAADDTVPSVVSDCLFCRIVAGFEPAHVVMNDETAMAFLDNRPLFVGHTLLVPRPHRETLSDLATEDIGPLFVRAQRLARVMETELGASGSFVAVNNKVSQSVPHLHVHVVPRRPKDGLRGFFWPRTHYDDEEHAASTAAALARAYRAELS
jgi:histidine triad (HIT) family protein